MEVLNQPPNWTFTSWVSEVVGVKTHIYVFYAGDLYDEEHAAIPFEINIRFTADNGFLLKQVANETFQPEPVETYTLQDFVVSAAISPSVVFTLVDGTEQESGGVVHLLPVGIIPDHNRDGMINHQDYGKVTAENPFRWWINDNNEMEEDYNLRDLPGQEEPDHENLGANGIRDLIDYFPLKLDIAALLEAFPPGEYTYVLAHSEGAFNFIEMPFLVPDSSPEGLGAGAYLRRFDVAMEAVANPGNHATETDGELSVFFLAEVAKGNGVLLVEASKATQQPLQLILKKGQEEKIRFGMPTSIDLLQKMYRWGNTRGAAGGSVARPTNFNEPPNYPDSQAISKWFIFVHGYNVNEEAAESWNASVFKRTYQSGSNARYVAITWRGDQGQINLNTFGLPARTPDFWKSVENAFDSADALKNLIHSLPTGQKIIAAHSLGNMVVCSAIADKGLNVSKFFLLNAAVTTEAFDDKNGYQPIGLNPNRMLMVRPDWKNPASWGIYDSKLYAAEYWRHFPSGDGRRDLSWVGRFRSVVNNKENLTTYNYWSSKETAAAASDGNVPNNPFDAFKGQGAWVLQEMEKGRAGQVLGTLINPNGVWNSTGGWGFGLAGSDPLDSPAGPEPAATANTKESEELRVTPFCKKFKEFNGQSVHKPQNDAAASALATQRRDWFLAYDVPALSSPAGGIAHPEFDGNANLQGLLLKQNVNDIWIHSDMIRKKPPATKKFYDDLVFRGNLKN